MSVRLIIREAEVEKRKLVMALEVHCEKRRPNVRAPRIELVFDNGWDNRRMVMPLRTFLPKNNDSTGTIWVAKAKYTYFLTSLFWYGTWEQCRMHIDISYDGELYEAVPIELNLRKANFKESDIEKQESQGEDDDEEENEIVEEVEIQDKYEFVDNYLDIFLGEPAIINPPIQPNKIQVVLGILIRLLNGILGILYIPWYCIDTLAIMFLPTERKDPKLNKYGFFGKYIRYIQWRYFSFCRNARGKIAIKRGFMKLMYQFCNAFHRNKKTVLFLSNRRNDLSGNFEYVHEYLKNNPKIKIDYWMNNRLFKDLSLWDTFRLSWKCGKAKIILIDDYVTYIRSIIISEDTMIMQMWHACGAFKTFGYSRLGKKGGPKQKVRIHRDYNYCFVSSKNIAKYYAEGFGLAIEKVLPYGVPRTDIFLNEKTKEEKRKEFFNKYPELEGKIIILFAPTFRGKGKGTAFYDADRFEPNQIAAKLPEDHVILIKHHPFVEMKYSIAKKNKNRIYDFSQESEINDLLFVTDILITDYSSVIYEASLLEIPMLFYAYDLEDYIISRDFYFEYEINVPGKIVYNQEEMVKALLEKDFEQEKVADFRNKNFDMLDGKASERIAAFIEKKLFEKNEAISG